MDTTTLKQILSTEEASVAINKMRLGRLKPMPFINDIRAELNPYRHRIFDVGYRPDSKVLVDTGRKDENGEKIREEQTVYVARVALALQKLIVKRAVAFCFGNDVLLNCEASDNEQPVLEAVKSVLSDVKIRSFNWRLATSLFSFTEVAEVWWLDDTPTKKYGFDSPYRLRCSLLDVDKGYRLYPYFDDRGRMIAFSFQYQTRIGLNEDDQDIEMFETYTDDMHYKWTVTQNGWELCEGFPKKLNCGKIPVVYGWQPRPEWADVQKLIERLEDLLSNFADTNDYHASPILFGVGSGFENMKNLKGKAGKVVVGDEGSSLQYISWQQAPESVKTEIDTLLRMIYSISQTPDISFENVKSLGGVSGVALKLLFMDDELKTLEKRGIFDEYLQRRINIILSFLGTLNKDFSEACETIQIEPEVVTYGIQDDQTLVNTLMSATGQKPILSQEAAIDILNFTNNSAKEKERIAEEDNASAYRDVTSPTV